MVTLALPVNFDNESIRGYTGDIGGRTRPANRVSSVTLDTNRQYYRTIDEWKHILSVSADDISGMLQRSFLGRDAVILSCQCHGQSEYRSRLR